MKPIQGLTEYGGIRLGDRIKARVNYGPEGGTMLPPETGTVVYIHPLGRFYTLRFDFAMGSFRESFPIRNRIEAPMPGAEPGLSNLAGPRARWLKTM